MCLNLILAGISIDWVLADEDTLNGDNARLVTHHIACKSLIRNTRSRVK